MSNDLRSITYRVTGEYDLQEQPFWLTDGPAWVLDIYPYRRGRLRPWFSMPIKPGICHEMTVGNETHLNVTWTPTGPAVWHHRWTVPFWRAWYWLKRRQQGAPYDDSYE